MRKKEERRMKRKIRVHGVNEVKEVKGVKCYKFDLQLVS